MRWGALVGLTMLAGCNAPEQQPTQPTASPSTEAAAAPVSEPPASANPGETPSPSATASPAPQASLDPALLESRDCRTVAQAYFDALAQGDAAFAARVWDDPVIDAARLQALFHGYKQPRIALTGLEQEGAAGSSYCTVSGTLTDAADPARAPQKGQIVLKRVNDVPGATAAQLRWTIRSSTFVEKMQRSGTGAPA